MKKLFRLIKISFLKAWVLFFFKYLAKKEDRDLCNKYLKKGYKPIFANWKGKLDLFFEISDEDALELVNNKRYDKTTA